MTGSAAGRVLLGSQDAGAGFAVTEGRVLTAGHVVRDVATTAGGRPGRADAPPGPVLECVVDDGPAAVVRAAVAYQPEGGEPIPVTRVEVDTGLDVAVLSLQGPAPALLSVAGPVAAGARWRVETRPMASDPALTGTVTDPRRRLLNEARKSTTLIQLLVEQEVGGFQGYSGSPVLGEADGGVLGVLVEQGRWRASPQLGQLPPVANVLFAVPIGQVLTQFGLLASAAKPVTLLPLPAPFEVSRPGQLDPVIDALTRMDADGQVVGLAGMGGSGKSVLAAAAARDRRVEKAFPGGRFWLELGTEPPLLQLQTDLAAALGDTRPITDVPQGRARLSSLLAEHNYLLVLDNVWDQAHVAAFAVAGPPCRVLVTTRDAATVPDATVIPVGELGPEKAIQVLAGWAASAAGQLPAEAKQVARECGYLPLALAVCGALINAGSHDWEQLLGLIRHADLDAVPIPLEGYPHPSLAVALAASIDALPADAQDRYLELAVFSGLGSVPVSALQVLWGLGQQPPTAIVRDLADKSLLRAEAGRVSLHDLQMDYLSRRAPDLPALHNQLLAAYARQCSGGWASGPDDGYFYQHLAHHLRQAGRLPELKALLLNLDWINARLTTGIIAGLLADYDSLPTEQALRLVAGALRLSAHVLADYPSQLPSQLSGRLANQTNPDVRDLLHHTRQWPAPWLRPMTTSLTPSGGPLQRILTGHQDTVLAAAISADGRRAVSGGRDNTVRVWDLDTGVLLRTLSGHQDTVHAVAISADGRRAVSGGWDNVVRVWDLDTGALLRTLTGHDGSVSDVAVSADGRRAVSGGDDTTVRVWDLDTGTLLRALTGHDASVTAVAVSADGRRAVSGGADKTVRVWDLDSGALLRTLTKGQLYGVGVVAVSSDGRRAVCKADQLQVWDLDTGALLHTLTGHKSFIAGLTISADGRRAFSNGLRGSVHVWDLDTGALLRTLTGHDDFVHAVAVSADGRRVVSGSDDKTLRVWDLAAETLGRTLTGYDDFVRAVAVSADGRRAVSGGDDTTVRVWDLNTGMLLRALTGHDDRVKAVAVSADGRRAVSGGADKTVRVWDLNTGTLLHTLTSDQGNVWAVAISADGRRAVSGGDDTTVRVWDLNTGMLLHTLTGHRSRVSPVAISADGRRAVSCGTDNSVGNTVQIWDLATGKRVVPARHKQRFSFWFRRPPGHADRPRVRVYGPRTLAISADGRRAVSSSKDKGLDKRVRVWDLDTGALLHTLTGHDDQVHAVAVSGDGHRVVSGSEDKTLRIWDLDTGALLHTLVGHQEPVRAVAISADGYLAVSIGEDKTVRMWDAAQGLELTSFTSDNSIATLAATTSCRRLIVGSPTGLVHLLELCGYE